MTIEAPSVRRRSSLFRGRRKLPKVVSMVTLHHPNDSNAPKLKSCLSANQLIAADPNKSVSFSVVQTRAYERTVGDNPSTRSGPPLTLSWDYEKLPSVPIDAYESHKGPRRGRMEYCVPRFVREELLQDAGVSRSDMVEAAKQVRKVQKQRLQSMKESQKTQEVWEAAGRKLKRVLWMDQPEDLCWVQAEDDKVLRVLSLSDLEQWHKEQQQQHNQRPSSVHSCGDLKIVESVDVEDKEIESAETLPDEEEEEEDEGPLEF